MHLIHSSVPYSSLLTGCQMCSLSGLEVTRLLVMAHTCHQRCAHLRVIRLTWTPSLPWLPSLYMLLPLVLYQGVLVSVSVSCLCVVRVSCFVLCCVYLLKHSLPELASRLSVHVVTLGGSSLEYWLAESRGISDRIPWVWQNMYFLLL